MVMEVIVRGTDKEIAELLLAVKAQRGSDIDTGKISTIIAMQSWASAEKASKEIFENQNQKIKETARSMWLYGAAVLVLECIVIVAAYFLHGSEIAGKLTAANIALICLGALLNWSTH